MMNDTQNNNIGVTGKIDRKLFKKRVKFNDYEVVLLVNENNEFIDIIEISLEKDFRSPEQKAKSIGFCDVNDLYQ